jgi:WD40 repeat protein/Tol biopolymer transport system component/DNA-directed RNA polymerase specialized sigma24 family protein
MTSDGLSTPSHNPETDLAYALQHGRSGDPHLADLLIQRYGADLARFVAALLDLPGGPHSHTPGQLADQQPPTEEIDAHLRTILYQAVNDLESFWGQPDVRTWLFAVARASLAKPRWRNLQRWLRRHRKPPQVPGVSRRAGGEPFDSTEVKATLLLLPETVRQAVVLRYSHGLGLDALGPLFRKNATEIHHLLVDARRWLRGQLDPDGLPAGDGSPPGCTGWRDPDDDLERRIQQDLDGLLEQDPYGRSAYKNHLTECPACRAQEQGWQVFMQRLSEWLANRYPAPSSARLQRTRELVRVSLGGEVAGQIHPERGLIGAPRNPDGTVRVEQGSIPTRSGGSPGWLGTSLGNNLGRRLGGREISWALILLVALVAVYWGFSRVVEEYTPQPGREGGLANLLEGQPSTARPTPTALPTPIRIPSEARAGRMSTIAGPNVVWSGDASISADGRFVAFASLADFWVEGDTNQYADIFVYDRETGEVERLSTGRNSSQAAGESSMPNISGDGRFVVFLSRAPNLNLPESLADGERKAEVPISCQRTALSGQQGLYCTDVFLADRLTGEILRLTQPPEGDSVPGAYWSPSISENGQVVAFWTSSRWLPNRASLTCGEPDAGPLVACLDLVFYDVASGEYSRLELGRPYSFRRSNPVTILPLSLSVDGRYVALTVRENDGLASMLELDQASRVYLYDRLEERFEPLDASLGGAAGNGASHSPVITADARFAAFVSEASNLVAGDTNGAADVFWRDLSTGEIRRVSVSSSGAQGERGSGSQLMIFGSRTERPALSADGRYVAFVSEARGLAGDLQAHACWAWSSIDVCNAMYVHDTLTGETVRVSKQEADTIYRMPSFSADGRFLAFHESQMVCPGAYPYQVCRDVWLFDLEARRGYSLALGKTVSTAQTNQAQSSAVEISRPRSEAGLLPYYQTGGLPANHPVAVQAHTGALEALAVSPDGRLLATGGGDGRVVLWAADDLREIFVYPPDNPQNATVITALAFSPDGEWLATGDQRGTVRIYHALMEGANFAARHPAYTLASDHIGAVRDLAYAPDGELLAIAAGNGLNLWQQAENAMVFTPSEAFPPGPALAIAFSPAMGQEGELMLALGLPSGMVHIYELPGAERGAARQLLRLDGHNQPVRALAFFRSGEYLVSSAQDHLVNLWTITKNREGWKATYLDGLEHGSTINAVETSNFIWPTFLAGEDGSVLSWLADFGYMGFGGLPEGLRVRALAYNPSRGALYAGDTEGMLHAWQKSDVVANPAYFRRVREPGAFDNRLIDQPRTPAMQPVYPADDSDEPPIYVFGPPSGDGALSQKDDPGESPLRQGLDMYWTNLHPVFSQTYYEVEAEIERPLLAPAYLPPGYRLVGVRASPRELAGAMSYYEGYLPANQDSAWGRQADMQLSGQLFLRQWPVGREMVETQILPETVVQRVEVGGSPGELVRGTAIELVTPYGEKVNAWWQIIPIYHLRWRTGGVNLALDYYPSDPGLDLDELIEIAASMQWLNHLDLSEPTNYSVRAGDTCFSIAYNFGMTIAQVIDLNSRLTPSCGRATATRSTKGRC